MSRLALYRKWRPMTFHDVVEQRHVVETLKNSLKNDAIGHAYLFCGTRGTGKTTMAKIFSRAINCLNPNDGDPCNACSICRGILEGSILDVMEMDAASNNSVDNIRDIRDEVVYAPAISRYKVYIIDEVHMLSSGAFNALLKTLEEPPERVVFILATTEPQKLPATVLSRCQRFDFKRITEHGIAERLGEIAADCAITVAPDALLFLSRLAGGAMRDAISLLDQLTTLGHTDVTLQDVNEMAGFASNARIRGLAGALLDGDIDRSWTLLDELMREGRDLSQLCVQLLGWFRNALLLQMGGSSSPLLDLHPDDLADARKAADSLKSHEIADWLRELSEHELRLRRTDNPRIMMEVLLLRLCTRSTGRTGSVPAQSAGSSRSLQADSLHQPGERPPGMPAGSGMPGPEMKQMEERLGRLERQLADLGQNLGQLSRNAISAMPGNAPSGGTGIPVGRQTAGSSMELISAAGKAPGPEARNGGGISGLTDPFSLSGELQSDGNGSASRFQSWPRVIDEIRRSGMSKPGGMKLYACILDSECLQVAPDQLRVVVAADDFLKKKVLAQSDSLVMMRAAVCTVTGRDCQIKVVDTKEAAVLKSAPQSSPAAIPKTESPPVTPVSSVSSGFGSDDAWTGAGPFPDEPGKMESTGDAALDRLLHFGRETGMPIQIRDETDS